MVGVSVSYCKQFLYALYVCVCSSLTLCQGYSWPAWPGLSLSAGINFRPLFVETPVCSNTKYMREVCDTISQEQIFAVGSCTL